MIPGELHSPKEKYYENRKLKLRNSYKKGKENDPFEAYFESGQLHYKGPMKYGKHDGLWEHYNEGGAFITELLFNDGERISEEYSDSFSEIQKQLEPDNQETPQRIEKARLEAAKQKESLDSAKDTGIRAAINARLNLILQ